MFPPIRGEIANGQCYIFLYRESYSSVPESNFVYCKITFTDPLTAVTSVIDAFSPCFTKVSGNYVFDLDDSSTPIQHLLLPGNTTKYIINSIQPVVCNVAKNSSNGFNIIGENSISVTLTPDLPPENNTVVYSSFGYTLSSTSKMLYFQNGSTITYSQGNPEYTFCRILGSGALAYPLNYTSDSPVPFKMYFVSSSFTYLSNGTCSNSIAFNFSVFDFLFPFTSTMTYYQSCIGGQIFLQNSNVNCAFTTSSECQTGYYYDYCSPSQQCGKCFGPCKDTACRELTQAQIALTNPIYGFTCNSIPSPPSPSPNPFTPGKDTRLKREVTFFIIATVCIVALGLFLIYLLPGKREVTPKNENVINLLTNYTPPGYIESE